MAIKRVTVEIDDKLDTVTGTSPPVSLSGGTTQAVSEIVSTGLPQDQENYGEEGAIGPISSQAGSEAVGRTISDLVVKFSKEPRFMATILTIAAFVIATPKQLGLSDFGLPAGMAVAFNLVWFAIGKIASGDSG